MQPDTTLYPPVQPGMLVHWYFAGDTSEAPCPMLVTKVGEYALEGSVIVPGQATFSGKTGVLHVSRPEVRNYHRRDSGGWDYTPEMKALYQRLEAVGKNPSKELAARVKALEEMLEDLTKPEPEPESAPAAQPVKMPEVPKPIPAIHARHAEAIGK